MFDSTALNWFLFVLLIAISVMGLWAFYVWWKKDRHTRERFAFFGFLAVLGFAGLYLSALLLENSLIGSVVIILLKPLGFNLQAQTPPLSPLEAVLFAFVLVILVTAYITVFKNWNGQKSLAQHEQEQNRDYQDLCDHRLYNHAKLQQARQVLRSLIQERAVNEPSQ